MNADPLLAAELIDCPQCGERSFAADAAYVDASHVVATFVAACDHVGGDRVVFVDVDALTPVVRCQAITRAGRRCQRRAAGSSGVCAGHAAIRWGGRR